MKSKTVATTSSAKVNKVAGASSSRVGSANALVPELRFPEFKGDGDWNYNQLSLLAKPVKEKAKKLEPEDVLTLSGEHGLVRQTEYFGKTIAGSDLKRYIRIEQNDFVYNDRTTSAAKYGSLKRLTNYKIGAVSPIYKCFRFSQKEKPVFWEHYFDGGAHENGLSEFVNEGARAGRFNISVDTFLSISVCYPSEAEQQKIADCLGSLDDLIAAHSRKLDALQDHKKGLLQQLFPAEGETTPKLRFPEFEEDWKKKSFSELCSIKHGYAFEGEFFSNTGNYVLLTPGNFYEEGGYRDREEKQKYYTGKIPREYVLNNGDLLVAMTEQAAGLLGSPLLVPESDKFLHNQRLGLVVKKPRVAWVNEFFFYAFNSQPVRKAISGSASGAKVRHTSPIKIGEAVSSSPPSLPEQQKIADCLSDLDELITAQTEQIAALKTHKQGLMQQLFPNPELSKA